MFAIVLWTSIMLLLTGVPVAGLIASGWLATAAGDQTRHYLVGGSLTALLNFGVLGASTIVILSAAWIILATQSPRASLESAETSASNAGPYAALLTILGGWLFTIIHITGFSRIYAHWVTLTLTGLVLLATPFALRRWRQPVGSQPTTYHAPWQVTYRSGRTLWLCVAGGTAVCAATFTVLGLTGRLPFLVTKFQEPGHMTTYSKLDAGDCLGSSGLQLGGKPLPPKSFRVVPCASSHVAEVFDTGSYTQGEVFPGVNGVSNGSHAYCRRQFRSDVRNPVSVSVYSITEIVPSRSTWKAGDREVVCIAYKAGPGHGTGIPLSGPIPLR
jgi:hypothetical protein